jgi:hypothetical protein
VRRLVGSVGSRDERDDTTACRTVRRLVGRLGGGLSLALLLLRCLYDGSKEAVAWLVYDGSEEAVAAFAPGAFDGSLEAVDSLDGL